MKDKSITNGFILQTGEKVNFMDINPDDLPKGVVDELQQSPASQLDILYIRRNLHKQSNHLQGLEGRFVQSFDDLQKQIKILSENVEKALWADVTNGTKHRRLIGELIAEMYTREATRRDVTYLATLIKKNKKSFLTIMLTLITIAVVIRAHLGKLLDWTALHIFDLFKWLL